MEEITQAATEKAVHETIAHLRETGQLAAQSTTTNTQPNGQVGGAADVDFANMDMSTEAGRKAFDDFLAANMKERIEIPT